MATQPAQRERQAAAERPVRGCTCFRLRKLTRRVTQHYDSYLASAGLRITQFSVLSMLVHDDTLSLSELAARLEMDRTTLSRNLGPLESAGWVRLVPGRDARSRAAQLTAAGRDTWARAKPLWRQAQDALNAALDLERVAALHQLLDDSLAHFSLAQNGLPGED